MIELYATKGTFKLWVDASGRVASELGRIEEVHLLEDSPWVYRLAGSYFTIYASRQQDLIEKFKYDSQEKRVRTHPINWFARMLDWQDSRHQARKLERRA